MVLDNRKKRKTSGGDKQGGTDGQIKNIINQYP